MNATRFNERFEVFAKFQAAAGDKLPMAMMHTPLVVWEEKDATDFRVLDCPEAFFDNGCPRLPFSEFRVSGLYHFLGDDFMTFNAWLAQGINSGKQPTISIVVEVTGDNTGRRRTKERLLVADIAFDGWLSATRQDSKFFYKHFWFDLRARRVVPGDLPSGVVWQLCVEWVQKLCMDFFNPHLHLCRRHPRAPNGASVNWVKAREHYVLIHKSHPANSRSVIGKQVVGDGHTVDRAAHSRRAHYRMLRSPRYRLRQGQRVWVRSAWIGPKEWTDRSGQIYNIVDGKQSATTGNRK